MHQGIAPIQIPITQRVVESLAKAVAATLSACWLHADLLHTDS